MEELGVNRKNELVSALQHCPAVLQTARSTDTADLASLQVSRYFLPVLAKKHSEAEANAE
jgi:hypothetical protein